MAKKKRFHNSKRGAGMISEDRSAIANLPQQVVYAGYPKNPSYSYDLNDDIRGIDVQISDDVKKEQKKSNQQYPTKY